MKIFRKKLRKAAILKLNSVSDSDTDRERNMIKIMKIMGLFILFLLILLVGSVFRKQEEAYYKNAVCEIIGLENITVYQGQLPDFTDQVEGTANVRNLKVDAGEVQDEPGYYKVYYTWEDEEGREYEKIISVTVLASQIPDVSPTPPQPPQKDSQELENNEALEISPPITGDGGHMVDFLVLAVVGVAGISIIILWRQIRKWII